MARNERVYNLAQDWREWLRTRRFLCKPEQKGILARLIPDSRPSRGEPDGAMIAEMSAFNTSVTSLEPGKLVPFVWVYCEYRPKPAKTVAAEMNINRKTFYDRADTAAGEVERLTDKLVRLNRELSC